MKVKLFKIPEEKEEVVCIYTYEKTEDIEKLKGYVERECFREQILLCEKDNKIYKIAVSKILFIETMKDKLYIHTLDGIFEMKKRLYVLERELPKSFIRNSKSALMNRDKIVLYRPISGGMMYAEFENGEGTYISRKYVREMREKLKEEH